MRWIVALLATITATNAVPREKFYGDNSCSCGKIADRCCDDNDYNCICDSDDDSSVSISLTSPAPLPFYRQNYTYACVSDILRYCVIHGGQHSQNSMQINTNGILVLVKERLGVKDTLYY